MGKKAAKNSDLGRALARKKREGRASRYAPKTNAGEIAAATGRHTINVDERSKLQSVLDATDLEEFMLNATMANEGFKAQRYPGPLAPQIVVMTAAGAAGKSHEKRERDVRRELDRTALRIPRRPPWDASTTYDQLMHVESEQFLKWRRKIANMEEEHSLASTIGGPMMTPFEKNLEVWRQLWRVVERSDVVVQIVDARNPLLFYCEDLFRYVTLEMQRGHLLLLNKADLLSSEMITEWETYFKANKLDVIFFSAFKASVNESVADSRVLGTRQLIERLGKYERKAPQVRENQRLVVGMCGYPNVGKSSTINILIETATLGDLEDDNVESPYTTEGEFKTEVGENMDETEHLRIDGSSTGESAASAHEGKVVKRVAVSSTPGKTKHFQTLVLSEEVLLCDCPGLVFPNFSSSKAELICAGVLSIDQLRGDYLTPVSLIAERMPSALLAGVYGLRFPEISDGILQDRDETTLARVGYVSATVLLDTHARARGFMSDHDKADQSRSARAILKDYVNGHIVFAHGPGGGGESGVGPAVHARKGRLVYARKEALEAAQRGEKVERKGLKENEMDGLKGGKEIRALVSGSKKFVHKEFLRVQRNYNGT